MQSPPIISVIVTCKGRLRFLQQTIPPIVDQLGQHSELILVDYDCPDRSGDWARQTFGDRVRVLRLEDQPRFIHADAMNRGVEVARGEWILMVDADVVIPGDFLASCLELFDLEESSNRYYVACRVEERKKPELSALMGMILVRRRDLEAVGLYDTRFSGYGGYDVDIRRALSFAWLREFPIPRAHALKHLEHDHELRTQFHPIKDRRESMRQARRQFVQKWGGTEQEYVSGWRDREIMLWQKPPRRALVQRGREKVFGIGLSRTGTTTLTWALEHLGYRTVHYAETWEDILYHDAATDVPVATFYPELEEFFPRAKFVLTTRDPQRWLESYLKMHMDWMPQLTELREQTGAPLVNVHNGKIYEQTLRRIYQKRSRDHEHLLRVFQDYTRRVAEHFSNRPEKLLVLDVSTPGALRVLAEFLGKECDQADLPRLNDREGFIQLRERHLRLYDRRRS